MRCELSDLEEDQCACRIHKPEAKLIATFYIGEPYSFAAKFDGKCAECKEKTHEGELITRTRVGYVHKDCT